MRETMGHSRRNIVGGAVFADVGEVRVFPRPADRRQRSMLKQFLVEKWPELLVALGFGMTCTAIVFPWL
jgi:hypothetical protein